MKRNVTENKRGVEKRGRQLYFNDAIADSIGEGVYTIDREGCVTFMNRAAERMLGWKEAELLGQNIHERIHFQRADGTPVAAEDCPLLGVLQAGGTVSGDDDVFTRKDGSIFPVAYTSSPIVTEGEIVGAVLAFRDATERKRGERNLAVQYAVTRALAESATLGEATPKLLQAICENLGWEIGALWSVDRKTDLLRYVETWHAPSVEVSAFEELSRQRTFERGMGLPGRVWESGEPAWIADIAANGNFPRAAAAARQGLHGAFGFPVRLEAEILGVMEFFSREIREPDENLLRMMATIGSQVGQFIERKAAEEAQRESEERFRTLAETASDAIITIDEESIITYVNRAGETIFGHSVEEMRGAKMDMLMPEYLRRLHEAGLKRYVETGQKHISWDGVELPGLHKDGHEIPVEIAFSEFSRNGKRYFTGIVRDITERKRAEAALEERAQLAALGADIGVALNQGNSMRDMLQRCAETLVKHLDAAFARVWTLDETGSVLELQASAGIYTHLDGAHARVPVGLFKIGLIAEECKPHLTNSVIGDPRVSDQEWAMREGMVAFAGFPLIVDERLVGVTAMFARHPLTEAALAAMESIANGIALGIERKRGEQTLHEQKDALARLNEQRERMIEEVSTPVVPVWRGVLALPIIGSLDTERMQRATEAALSEVMRTNARALIIDITGARIVDSHAIANLSNLVMALNLIGAEAYVTGVTAQAAASLVGLGVDFTSMKTRRTLAEALASIIKSLPQQQQVERDEKSSNGTSKEHP
ncbi:MAG TPA: PAS domain S-box protein [Pyrinomonadaceae bacterium]